MSNQLKKSQLTKKKYGVFEVLLITFLNIAMHFLIKLFGETYLLGLSKTTLIEILIGRLKLPTWTK